MEAMFVLEIDNYARIINSEMAMQTELFVRCQLGNENH